MNFAGLLFLITTQILCGRGLIGLFNIRMKPAAIFLLSIMIGIVLISFMPVILEVCHIPITQLSISISISILTILVNIAQITKYDFSIFKKIKLKRPELYELVFIVLFIALMIPSVWRCIYYPPYARDILSGAEALAEYTIREKTIINSIFTIDLSSTNNHLKPPFVLDLQIIYKLLVHPFGQIWLTIMSLSFIAWLYLIVREKLHPLLVGIVMLFFITIPDLYGYTYVLLFDYCNMIFFFAGFYFLAQYAYQNEYKYFLFSAFLFGLATYIRLETIVLLGMIIPLLLFLFVKNKMKIPKIILSVTIILGFSYLLYYLWIGVFVKYYMPIPFDVDSQLNITFKNTSVIWEKLQIITTQLAFGGIYADIYGYFIYFFVIWLSIDIIFFRRSFNLEAIIALYGILVVYFAMPLLGYMIPWFDIANTTKRGLFKLLPLMVLYLRNSRALLKISSLLQNFESEQPIKVEKSTVTHAPFKPRKGSKKNR